MIFYHFGSVDSLLLAALDVTSEERMSRYRAGLEGVESLEELLAFARRVYEEDRASGHMTVVSQLVAGSLARPELAPEVLARMEPWIEFSEAALVKVLRGTPLEGALPTKELAYAAVTFYLGVNLLTALDPDRRQPDRLFERAAELAPLAAPLFERQ